MEQMDISSLTEIAAARLVKINENLSAYLEGCMIADLIMKIEK